MAAAGEAGRQQVAAGGCLPVEHPQAGALSAQQLKVMNDAQVEAVIKAYKGV